MNGRLLFDDGASLILLRNPYLLIAVVVVVLDPTLRMVESMEDRKRRDDQNEFEWLQSQTISDG